MSRIDGNGHAPGLPGATPVRVAIVGVGNCASSLVQGRYHYQDTPAGDLVPGLVHVDLGGYHVRDIEFVAAFDVSAAKVGRDPGEAIDAEWQSRFAAAGLPLIGDDIKSQVGATSSHRVLTRLFADRSVRIDRTYQSDFGGNTGFQDMLERDRLESKKISKTDALTSMLDYEHDEGAVHVGPSDHVHWLQDRESCHIRMEGTTYGDVPLLAELKLEVWDSPGSAGVITDAIRCAKLGLDHGLAGTLVAPSAYFMKGPPQQLHDDVARRRVEAFIRGEDLATLTGEARRPSGAADAAAVVGRAGQETAGMA